MTQRINSPEKISVVCFFHVTAGMETRLEVVHSKLSSKETLMLVLSRKEDQSIVFPNLGISIEIVRVQGNKVSVGVDAPKAIRIVRGELQTVSDANRKDSSSEFQLGQFIEILPPAARNELRSQLNLAGLAVHAAQQQFEIGGHQNAEFFLSKAVEALHQLNKLFDAPQLTSSSECVKEPQSTYAVTKTVPSIPPIDRGVTDWFTKPAHAHQLIAYLQHQLCSSN